MDWRQYRLSSTKGRFHNVTLVCSSFADNLPVPARPLFAALGFFA